MGSNHMTNKIVGRDGERTGQAHQDDSVKSGLMLTFESADDAGVHPGQASEVVLTQMLALSVVPEPFGNGGNDVQQNTSGKRLPQSYA
jgi:hypothetical protein